MQRPSLSIVIATHNRPQLLLRALASIFTQKIAPLEVIIVDDASTMNVQKILPKANNISIMFALNRHLGLVLREISASARHPPIGYFAWMMMMN